MRWERLGNSPLMAPG